MRIALVTETYPPEVNGVAMTNQRLVRGLLKLGHQLLLIKPHRSQAQPTEHANLSVHEVSGIPIPNYAGLKMGLPYPGELEHVFEDVQPDIVHVATEGPLGLSSLRAARKLKIPVSSTFHTNFQDYCADYGAAFAERGMMAYLRWFHNTCALTTVPDPSLIQRLKADGIQHLEMLGRGADTELFSPAKRDPELRQTWGADKDTLVAIYVGRAAAEKNIPLSLEAWAVAREACPGLKMVVVGDGPVRTKLAQKWPDVHFAGMRYDEDLARHYASADVLLFASNSETFGNVVIEAMASGLAVLTYNYAAGKQFIQSGHNGYLVPLNDREAWIQSAKDILLCAPCDLKELRQAARRTTLDYPWSATIERFAHLLQHAANLEQNTAQIDIVSEMAESRL
jgi:glycosyltransferase involved in cell wall biosynthesis